MEGKRLRPEDAERLRRPPLSPEAQAVSDMFDDLKRKTDQYYALRDLADSVREPAPAPAEEKPTVHRRHWCLHCGGTIEPHEAENVIMGTGISKGQRRYYHADQKECADSSRRQSRQQNKFVSGGLVRGKR